MHNWKCIHIENLSLISECFFSCVVDWDSLFFLSAGCKSELVEKMLKNFASAAFLKRGDLLVKFSKNSFLVKNLRRSILTQAIVNNKVTFNSKVEKSFPDHRGLIFDSTKRNQSNSSLATDKTPELVIANHKDGIVEAQINRPQGKNSISKKLLFELEIFINSIKNDRRVRCVVIRSLVPGVFCAGKKWKIIKH